MRSAGGSAGVRFAISGGQSVTPVSQGQLLETRAGQSKLQASHTASLTQSWHSLLVPEGMAKNSLGEKAAVAQHQDVEFLCPILLSLLTSDEFHIGETSN